MGQGFARARPAVMRPWRAPAQIAVRRCGERQAEPDLGAIARINEADDLPPCQHALSAGIGDRRRYIALRAGGQEQGEPCRHNSEPKTHICLSDSNRAAE